MNNFERRVALIVKARGDGDGEDVDQQAARALLHRLAALPDREEGEAGLADIMGADQVPDTLVTEVRAAAVEALKKGRMRGRGGWMQRLVEVVAILPTEAREWGAGAWLRGVDRAAGQDVAEPLAADEWARRRDEMLAEKATFLKGYGLPDLSPGRLPAGWDATPARAEGGAA